MYPNMKERFTFYNKSEWNNSQLTESLCDFKGAICDIQVIRHQ